MAALAVMTVSDTRTLASDASGDRIIALAEAAGHRILERAIVPDEPDQIQPSSWAGVGRSRWMRSS